MTAQQLNDLKPLTTLQLSQRLDELHRAHEEARRAFEAARSAVLAHTAARELHTSGIWLGDRVRDAERPGKVFAVVATSQGAALQPLAKGEPKGAPVPLWYAGCLTKID